jgi:hypothetical protein
MAIVMYAPGMNPEKVDPESGHPEVRSKSSYSPERILAEPGPFLNCAWIIASSF